MALFPFNFTPPLIDFASVAQGINCRFGARGIISEAHYDGGRNFVAMLRGMTFETMKACVMYTGMYVSSHRIFFFFLLLSNITQVQSATCCCRRQSARTCISTSADIPRVRASVRFVSVGEGKGTPRLHV